MCLCVCVCVSLSFCVCVWRQDQPRTVIWLLIATRRFPPDDTQSCNVPTHLLNDSMSVETCDKHLLQISGRPKFHCHKQMKLVASLIPIRIQNDHCFSCDLFQHVFCMFSLFSAPHSLASSLISCFRGLTERRGLFQISDRICKLIATKFACV